MSNTHNRRLNALIADTTTAKGIADALPTKPQGTHTMILQADGGDLYYTLDGTTPVEDGASPDGVGTLLKSGQSVEITSKLNAFKVIQKVAAGIAGATVARLTFIYDTID